ncbi:alpha/beta-hydrolase, partial [Periconia macrospinosa]
SPNYIRTQTASPEVISSLIDSLSAISASTHNHFENLPTSYGDTQSLPVSPHPLPQSHDAAVLDRSPYYQNLKLQNDLYPDDEACEPPVIRTSKPPSGLSPLTAPKKKDKDSSLRSYVGPSGGSSPSLRSSRSLRSVSSIGNISIEAGIPRKPSNASIRSSSESKRSAKGHRSLMYMPSLERMRMKDVERKRPSFSGSEATTSGDPIKKSIPQRPVAEDTIKEESVVAESSRTASQRSNRGASPLPNGVNLLGRRDGGSPHEQGLIPARASSLRHSGSPSRKSKKSRRTRESSRSGSHKTNTVVEEEDENVDREASAKEANPTELAADEDDVARRIKELKAQKMLRERVTGKLPVGASVGADAGAAPLSAAPVSPLRSAQHSPASSISSASEQRIQAPAKALKILGIAMQPESAGQKPAQLAEATAKSQPQGNFRTHRHTRAQSSTGNDTDDFTPLPIDYQLALKALDKMEQQAALESSSTTLSGSSKASIKTDDTTLSMSPPRRTRSAAAVGGRSASSRKLNNNSLRASSAAQLDAPNSYARNPPPSASSDRTTRSASEEIATRHFSLTMDRPPPALHSLQQRPPLKKKRWSHPDLPAKAEKMHNDKLDAIEAARARGVQLRTTTPSVIEERPASRDSIDVDVDKFLGSSRLSQKIRHPQTGRIISFSEVGDPQGFAVFVCVGMGLTRFVMAFYDQLASTLKLRLITPDRPGIGGSQVDPNGTPLSWPDDVLVICQALKITKFSLLAHSAGAVYALATSLRMPQHIRGRVHLLAPWIPPSQMEPIGISQDQPPTQQLPRSQRFLRALPPSLLKVANSTFLSATSASLQRTGPKNSPKTRRKSVTPQLLSQQESPSSAQLKNNRRESMMQMDQVLPNASTLSIVPPNLSDVHAQILEDALSQAQRERRQEFDERLTFAIWDRATANANPATDLIVCLETKQTIGFRYEDINRSVVIHHGSKDSRVPADNVRWLGRLMRKCEVRILEGEQHGLMASAQVMGNVLTELASDWEDWSNVVQGKANSDRPLSRKRTAERLRN